MADLRRDRRTKAGDKWGHKKVSFPTADAAAPVVDEVQTVRQNATLPGFGSAHPDTADFPNNFLVGRETSPGDDTDANLSEKYIPLPGTALTSKETTDWGNATTVAQDQKASTALTITNSTADAQSNAVDAVYSNQKTTNYDAFPTPWRYSYVVDQNDNIGVRVQKRLNNNGTTGSISTPTTVNITGVTVANPTVLTLSAPIPVLGTGNLVNGEQVTITGGTGITPALAGQYAATVIDSTHISIPVNVTVVTGSSFGTARTAAPIYAEVQDMNDRQCIEIWSQADSSTLPGATKTWFAEIDYPWREVLVGLDYFSDTGVGSTSNTGGFTAPTSITWFFSGNFSPVMGIRTQRYTGKTDATITRSYTIGPPVRANVQKIATSSGELIMTGTDTTTHIAEVINTTTTGIQTSITNTVKHSTARIEDVLTNGFNSGTSPGTGVRVRLDDSTPTNFTKGTTFLASADVNPGRLGLYVQEQTVITVPSVAPFL